MSEESAKSGLSPLALSMKDAAKALGLSEDMSEKILLLVR